MTDEVYAIAFGFIACAEKYIVNNKAGRNLPVGACRPREKANVREDLSVTIKLDGICLSAFADRQIFPKEKAIVRNHCTLLTAA